MNPYDFVPLPDQVQREAPLMHHRFQQRSGIIRCRLTAITPIFIRATQSAGDTQRFIVCQYTSLPIIPGSSLKGVIRCVAEAASPSCIGLSGELFDKHGNLQANYRGKINKEFETCKSAAKLCPSCRLFGMVGSQSHFLGKVGFGEARTQKGQFKVGAQMILMPLRSPHPEHTAFYLPHDRVAGRKFYFHHLTPKSTIQKTDQPSIIYPLEGLNAEGRPQTVFEFDVSFSNLTDYEYSLLLFALFLTDEMRHKVGGGKPYGLGTVKIEPVEIRPLDVSHRYRGMVRRVDAAPSADAPVLTNERMHDHIKETIHPFTASASSSIAALKRIWQYPPAKNSKGEPIDYKYPDQSWFGNNADSPLSETP